jgi:citrate lyase subunit beta/citryl-CoA lyase
VAFVHIANRDGWFVVPDRDRQFERTSRMARRSSLIMPVNNRRFVERAYSRGADAIVLDLEDSVAPGEKANAREGVREAIRLAGRGGADVLVRINKPFELAVADLDAAVWPGLAGIVFPKAEAAVEVQVLDRLLAEREAARGLAVGSLEVAILVETALGVQHIAEIACASPRAVSISLGSEDFTRDIGVEPTPEGHEQGWGKGATVVAARLAGIQPHGLRSTLADYSDLDGLRESVLEAKRMGFKGASVIHPTQVAVLNEHFSPTAAEVEYARRVIEVYEAAEAQGKASVGLEGKMIDIPVVERARMVVQRAEAIERVEERKRRALAALG